MHKDMKLKEVTVSGGKLTISRKELESELEVCIAKQLQCKAEDDLTMWLMAAGHIEAIKDLLACFES